MRATESYAATKMNRSWVPKATFVIGMALLLVAHAPRLSTVFADMVYYESGDTLKGLIVEEHRDRIVVSTEHGEWVILRKDIQEIFYDDPERNYLHLGNQAIATGDLNLAHGFFRKALQIHPDFQEAQDALNRVADLKRKAAVPEKSGDPLGVLQHQWGMILETTIDYPRVRAVMPASFAARSGIAEGDLLATAWGSSLAYLPLEEVARTLLGPAGSPLKITTQRRIQLPAASSKSGKWPGAALDIEPKGLTVKDVESSGVFAKSGVRAGDRIVSIADRSTRYMPLGDARRFIQEAKEKGLALLIHRDILLKRE